MMKIEMFSVIVIFLLFAQAHTQNVDCDFSQQVRPGTTYIIASPVDYSNGSYGAGRECRWVAICPAGYQCRVDCTLEMPLSSGCSLDALLISTSGDTGLAGASRYCGRQTLTSISNNLRLVLGMVASRSSPGGRFSCNLYAQQVQQPPPAQDCTCGIINRNRIVGGTPTGSNEYTMMAGLIDRPTLLILCGGVIISNRYILTAAHCVFDRTAGTIIISVGDRNLQNGQKYNVISITIHPNFNSNNYDYDISVLRTSVTITFSNFITPVCLPIKFQNADPTGVQVDLLGWGTTSFGGPTSSILLKTNTTIISQSVCRQTFPGVTARQVCTRAPGRDACQNDSGGPLIYIDPTDGRATCLGLISYGTACGSNSPSVNTNLLVLLSWVVNNAPADYCVRP